MHDGMIVDGKLRIVNPFRGGAETTRSLV